MLRCDVAQSKARTASKDGRNVVVSLANAASTVTPAQQNVTITIVPGNDDNEDNIIFYFKTFFITLPLNAVFDEIEKYRKKLFL